MLTVTLSKRHYIPTCHPFEIGQKIKVGKETQKQFHKVIKKHKMIARLTKKKFEPLFIVTTINDGYLTQLSLTIKPFNF